MSSSETQNQKKKGLAKLVKDRSVNNSLNNLDEEIETNKNKKKDEDLKVLINPGTSSVPSVLLTSPLPLPSHSQDTGDYSQQECSVIQPDVEVLLSKIEQVCQATEQEKKPIGSSSQPVQIPLNNRYIRKDSMKEKSSLSSIELDKTDTSSDPDACSSPPKEDKVESKGQSRAPSFFYNFSRKSFKKTKNDRKSGSNTNRSKSPSPSPCQLGVPMIVTRSRSLSRLSDAFDNVHHICLTPTKTSSYLEGKMRSGISTSWNTIDHSSFDDESSEEEEEDERQSPESDSEGIASRRWASLGQLSGGVGAVAPLFQVKLSEAKQKNYLFGGLGSLLGTNELNRYFPDRKIVVFIATWNMNGKEPPYSLDDFILPDDMEHMPDMFVIGTQESGGDRTEWEVRLQTSIGPSHVLFHSALLGILHLTVFLRRDLVWFCSVPEDASHSLRPGTYFKTKGAVAISFQFFGTKMLFVNTHLFAHEEKLQQRVQNYKQIVHNIDLPRNLRSRMMTKPKDVTNRFDIVFWLGDLNFRLAGPREEILERTKDSKTLRSNLQDILCFDQLNQSKNRGEIFHGFSEGNITFAPTFKFDVGTNHYDSSSKQRVPSYTDRILFKSTRDPVICSNYSSCPDFKTSDHKPVWGVFNIKVRPGKDDIPLAAGLFQRDVYLTALKRRRRFFHQPSSRNCQMQ